MNILYLITFIHLVKCIEFCSTFEHVFNPNNMCDKFMVESSDYKPSIFQFDEFKDLCKDTWKIIWRGFISILIIRFFVGIYKDRNKNDK